jgi:hypothetical protein
MGNIAGIGGIALGLVELIIPPIIDRVSAAPSAQSMASGAGQAFVVHR